jgi:Ca2+-binding EF-hand superfamily protein
LHRINQNKFFREQAMQSPVLFALIAALLAGGLAIAQSASDNTAAPKRPKHFSKFDDQFKAADKDGDGALTKEEAASAGLNRIVDNFDRIDANKDGKVTREEVRALIRHRVSS